MTTPTPPDVAEDQAPPAPIAPQTETQFVRMYHPGLNTEAEFPAASIGHHAVAGWQVIDEPSPEPEAAEPEHIAREEADAAQGITKSKSSKAGNRRASAGGDDPGTGTSEQEK